MTDLGHANAVRRIRHFPVAFRRDVEILPVPGHAKIGDETGNHIGDALKGCRIAQVGQQNSGIHRPIGMKIPVGMILNDLPVGHAGFRLNP